jgi:hypothetical protein
MAPVCEEPSISFKTAIISEKSRFFFSLVCMTQDLYSDLIFGFSGSTSNYVDLSMMLMATGLVVTRILAVGSEWLQKRLAKRRPANV